MKNLDMKITNSEKHLSAAAPLKERYTAEEKTKLAKAAKDFESLMTSMMLKNMNETTGGMFGQEGYGADMFDSMFENSIAEHMTASKSLGVAEQIYKKLTGESLPAELLKPAALPKETPISAGAVNSTNNHPAVAPSNKSLARIDRFEDIINEASEKYGVDKNIIKSVILAESAGNEKAVSPARAKGLMQLIDSTAKSMGVKNSYNPKENINGGTKYLAGLLRQYNGDLKLALAAYNAGPGNVRKYDGVPPFKETKNYIARVMGYLNHFNG